MRAVLGRILLFVGAFAVVASVVAIVWGKDAAYRIPLDTDSYSRLTGEASGALAKSDTKVPVTYVVHTQVDPKRSNDDVVAISQASCIALTKEFCIDDKGDFVLDGSDDQIVNIGQKKFAVDRSTGEPVEDQAAYISDSSMVKPYSGVVIKFPFDVKKKDYPYWDSTLNYAVTAKYKGEKKVKGLNTYEFYVEVPTSNAAIADGVFGSYAATQTIWVDPKTGSFIDQQGTQTLKLPDGTEVLDIAVKYTDETVQTNADDAKSNGRSLGLLGTFLRFYAPFIGVILLVAGAVLLRRKNA